MSLPPLKLKPRTGPLRRLAVLFSVAALSLVSLALADVTSSARAQSAPILGPHVVQRGETLYCIGRAYGVLPAAIAEVNGLALWSSLSPGQILLIPAVQWVNIPPGPVCTAQFLSPFPGLLPSTATPVNAPPILGRHVVQRGETLYCIGRAYGVWPPAIAQTNNLTAPYYLTPGQVLLIPAVRWTFIPRGPVCPPQFPIPGSSAYTTPPLYGTVFAPPGGGSGPGGPPPATDVPGQPTKTPIPTRTVGPPKTPTP